MVVQYGIKYLLEDQDVEEFVENWMEMMDLVKDAGYTAVDVSSYELMGMAPDVIRQELDKRGISVSSLIDFDSYVNLTPGVYEQKLATHKACMQAAVALGANVYMLAISSFGEVIPEGLSREEMHDRLLQYFQPLAAYGKQLGLHVVVEDTPDLRFHLDRAEDLEALLEKEPNLEVVYDSGNMVLVGEDPIAYYQRFAAKTAHIHLKDMTAAAPGDIQADTSIDGKKMTCAPVGTGIIDMPALLKEIEASGYDGSLTVEYAKHPDLDYAASLRTSREFYEKLINQ